VKMPQFHETPAGKRFIEATMPNLVEAVASLTRKLDDTNKVLDDIFNELKTLNGNLDLLNRNPTSDKTVKHIVEG